MLVSMSCLFYAWQCVYVWQPEYRDTVIQYVFYFGFLDAHYSLALGHNKLEKNFWADVMDNSLTKEKLYLQMLKLHYKVGTVPCYDTSKANLHNDIKFKTVAISEAKEAIPVFRTALQNFNILSNFFQNFQDDFMVLIFYFGSN